MSDLVDDAVFDDRVIAATVGALAVHYQEPVRVLFEQIEQTGFLKRHPAYLSFYEGMRVSGWPASGDDVVVTFELTFTDSDTGRTLVFYSSFRGGEQRIGAYLFDRSIGRDWSDGFPFLDVQEYGRACGLEFENSVDRGKPLSAEIGRCVSEIVRLLDSDLAHFVDGRLRLAGTDLRETSIDDVRQQVERLRNVDLPDVSGQTLLFHAAKASRPDLVAFLLDSGAAPDCGAIWAAASHGVSEDEIVGIVERLVAAGGNPDSSVAPAPQMWTYRESREVPLGRGCQTGALAGC